MTVTTTLTEDGFLFTFEDVSFTGDLAQDVQTLEKDEEIASFLWGDLPSDGAITDKDGDIEYSGADVQDFLADPCYHWR